MCSEWFGIDSEQALSSLEYRSEIINWLLYEDGSGRSLHAGLDVYRSQSALLVFHDLGIEVWVVWFRVLICIMIGQWLLP